MILSLADLVKIPLAQGDWSGMRQYIDHILIAPGRKRFCFLQRWGEGIGTGFFTRMCTADAHGKALRVIDGSGQASHYDGRDPETLMLTNDSSHGTIWYLIHEPTLKFAVLDAERMNQNGHNSFFRGGRRVASDTSPDKKRKQHEYLYDTKTRRKIELGASYSPHAYKASGAAIPRRASARRAQVSLRFASRRSGPQMYMIDISQIVG
jgi:hypothetical protein